MRRMPSLLFLASLLLASFACILSGSDRCSARPRFWGARDDFQHLHFAAAQRTFSGDGYEPNGQSICPTARPSPAETAGWWFGMAKAGFIRSAVTWFLVVECVRAYCFASRSATQWRTPSTFVSPDLSSCELRAYDIPANALVASSEEFDTNRPVNRVNLGAKVIDGLETTGTRESTVLPTDPNGSNTSLEYTKEFWYSQTAWTQLASDTTRSYARRPILQCNRSEAGRTRRAPVRSSGNDEDCGSSHASYLNQAGPGAMTDRELSHSFQVGDVTIGGGKLFLIAGPCVIESEAHALEDGRSDSRDRTAEEAAIYLQGFVRQSQSHFDSQLPRARIERRFAHPAEGSGYRPRFPC